MPSRAVQVIIGGVVLVVLWMASMGPSRSALYSVGSGSSSRVTALMEKQESMYGLKMGQSNDFESPPPAEFDSTAPSFFLPDVQTPLTDAPYPPLPPADTEEYLAICLVVRNQSIDMPEFFIHHYHHHGIRKFYVYDDGTKPQLAEKPYVESWGIPDKHIEFTYVAPEDVLARNRLQADLYTECVNRALGKHMWVGLLDPDEFMEMRGENPPTLKEYLKEKEKDPEIGAMAVHWLNHNSDDVLTKQDGHVRQAFKKCIANEPADPKEIETAKDNICGMGHNRNIKTFVRPDRFASIENIHFVKLQKGFKEVNEIGEEINTWCHWPVTQRQWALHHYMTKSQEDWQLKLGRHR